MLSVSFNSFVQVRPRGWHLDEKNVSVNGTRMSGSLFDFGLYFFHNAKELLHRGYGPVRKFIFRFRNHTALILRPPPIVPKSFQYFYLPKLESHLEARLWNDVFIFAQNELGIPKGTCIP